MSESAAPSSERMPFQAEVSRLLDIVARSIYSQKDVFLRELISNASDACDRLRYAALTDPALIRDEPDFAIRLSTDRQARTLTVSDNGVGMSRQELVDHLGTIAKSGSSAFLDSLTGDAKKDVALIGQFGVGFYAAFMVADRVEVISRRAGADEAWRWESDGKGSFEISPAERAGRGTDIILHLGRGEDEFLDPARLEQIVRTHSDHIAIPVKLDEAGETRTLNRASALWTRPKAEISQDEYTEFYRHVAHAADEPWAVLHSSAEGVVSFTALLFIPGGRPFDLYTPERAPRLRLYVRRVLIDEAAEDLAPSWLRFLRGVVDSEDLPLNISRETLQANRMVAKIRQIITRRVLTELSSRAEQDPAAYETFWESFGAVLKEGLYEEETHRPTLMKLARFRSTAVEGWTDLAGYRARMKPGQKAIYTIAGDSVEAALRSPQLEGYRARGVEVLLMTDAVDGFWVPALGSYEDIPFRSVTRGDGDLEALGEPQEAGPTGEEAKDLPARLKTALGDAAKDVRLSSRLTDSPVCLVADESDMDLHLERMLAQHRQVDRESARVLEINPRHKLIQGVAALPPGPAFDAMAHLLLDQAKLMEGEPPADPAAFSRRLSEALARGLPIAEGEAANG